MTMEVFPESVFKSFPISMKERFETISSDFEGKNQQRQPLSRFPDLREISIPYNTVTEADWPTLHNFFRKRRGGLEPFWIFANKQRAYVDEYIGRGGPFYVDRAIADDGGVQTDESTAAQNATANDMTLLPVTPAVDDAYYFGYRIKFGRLIVTIGIQGAGAWTITWEYWNGTAWTEISGVSDGTAGFTAAAGDLNVTFTVPSDWVDCEVKDLNLYWIRARVSAYTSISTQPKGSYSKVKMKTFDLPSKSTAFYDGSSLCVNGNMELDSDWPDYNTPTTNERSSVEKYEGTYSRHLVGDAASDGFQQTIGNANAGENYRLMFFYKIVSGSIICGFTTGIGGWAKYKILTTTGSWQYAYMSGQNPSTGSNMSLLFTCYNGAAEFYIDQVFFYKLDDNFKIEINGIENFDFYWTTGAGGGGSDRITFDSYPSTGDLITADFAGLLRIKGVLTSDFIDDWYNHRHSRMNFTIKEVP